MIHMRSISVAIRVGICVAFRVCFVLNANPLPFPPYVSSLHIIHRDRTAANE